MIKYLIIDDEPIAHEIIKGYCDDLPDMDLGKHCYDAFEALEYLRENTVDLIFLDLNMPKLKGFGFLRTLARPPKIIVTTAYKEHALEGYELDIADYLLKPFGFERFLRAVNKAIPVKGNIRPTMEYGSKSGMEFIFLYIDKKHVQVKVDDVLYVEAVGNYCKVVLKESHILVRNKISEMLAKLTTARFIQVHKSYIVSKENIYCIEGNRILMGNREVPIGKLYKPDVIDFLKA